MQLGGGSVEPHKYGCRHNASSGKGEAQLYEQDCDDSDDIAIDCAYLCFK